MTDPTYTTDDAARYEGAALPAHNAEGDATAPEAAPGESTTPESVAPDIDGFWACGDGFEDLTVEIAAPNRALALLEKLGPSPFERGGFPVIGFLATTYDKVTRYALAHD